MSGETSPLWRAQAVAADAAGPAWRFAVAPGEALWIPDGDESHLPWLDWLTGIEAPPHGEVFWKGVEWRARSADAAAAERGRIGCVFADGGLLANLNMDENVWLPARIHRRADAAEAIETWARFFGVWPLPAVRTPAVRERARQKLAWTRAFAGQPDALILERPLREAAADDRARFLEGVRQLRAGGCAVIWIDAELNPATQQALEPLTQAAPAIG